MSATGVGQDLGGGHTEATISVFSLRGSTLTAQVNGTPTGAFQARSTSVAATGQATGVTGHVRIVGNENPTTGGFTETITGALCARKRPGAASTHAR